jgi:DNA-binding NarL/FixJ family response regulator
MRQNKRILLIDDEEVITFGFTKVLQRKPYIEVDSAQTVEEAIKLINAHQYVSAIVDLRLSNSIEIEGFKCMRLLHSTQSNCRIIVLTACGDDHLRKRANMLGADLYFLKPTEPEKIMEVLTKYGIYNL